MQINYTNLLKADATASPGLPDGIFSNQKNPYLGIFWRTLEWKILVYV
jgi:hypothetical protein